MACIVCMRMCIRLMVNRESPSERATEQRQSLQKKLPYFTLTALGAAICPNRVAVPFPPRAVSNPHIMPADFRSMCRVPRIIWYMCMLFHARPSVRYAFTGETCSAKVHGKCVLLLLLWLAYSTVCKVGILADRSASRREREKESEYTLTKKSESLP